MTPVFALGVPHAPHGGEQRLNRAHEHVMGAPCTVLTRIFDEQESNAAWSERMWTWGLYSGGSHFVTLQDDVETAPHFWKILTAMVTECPTAVWGLHSPRGLTPTVGSVYASSDGLIGTGYCLPVEQLRAFLRWRESIPRETLEAMAPLDGFGEDSLLGAWCYTQGIPILHPRPSFIRHDTTLASTYGNDGHAGRQPAYPVDFSDEKTLVAMCEPAFWESATPLCERYYDSTHVSLMRYLPDYPRKAFLRGHEEVCQQLAMRRLRVQGGQELRPRIKIATPNANGWVTEGYHHTVLALQRWAEVDVLPVQTYDYDVDVARSYIVREFLKGTGTHLFWIDSKVSFGPELAGGMLRALLVGGHDYVAAPYARTMRDPGPLRWAIRALSGPDPTVLPTDAFGCSEVAGAGLGCTLVTRKMLETMVDAYGDLRFTNPGQEPAVCLFKRKRGVFPDAPDEFPSEDYAFGARWRAIGGRVMLYRGNGAPAKHASMTVWG